MIDYTEITDGDGWELFCRDYLVAKRLLLEIPPGRGPDGGRDMLMKEQLKGELGVRSFTWLVSCKHNAESGKAVGTSDEQNISDRVRHHGADGFIGFYSTVASTALVDRLKVLRSQGDLGEFEIFDGARVEAGFHDVGLSGVLLQHLPRSHTSLRPIHPLLGEYVPLKCDECGKDLLRLSTLNDKKSLISFAYKDEVVHEVHFVCKGACNERMERRLLRRGLVQGWDDIDDYCNPLVFIRRLTGYMAGLRNSPSGYSDGAHARMVELFLAVSQRTLRQTNEEDRREFFEIREIDELGV